ncbi:hypothetical protein AWM79_05405 [Pseudomonas agarici]|uniref:DUF5636 domain-containing protein n=1 Tax=Pseudomonas agarici TaxID=46677 RepID=A0A0X1SY59_PSEAA|nr:LirA/MavJ family T4SS effector [Pseudomonas agarici]AMB84774.1 hypothetical protein AWM79_05405 [Pseudomonas agarici]NWB93826.1 hypothetical protein [Pseudomonas agarici]NWC09954.1 hypothetical protein [Pseudomonas agarici]SEL56045.1 hypothetical protein SAMN05216604_12243 [Pseudomonas agarici]
MSQSAADVERDLRRYFSPACVGSKYFDAYCQIGAHLSSVDNCREQLKKLDAEMSAILIHRIAEMRGKLQRIGNSLSLDTLHDLLKTLAGARNNRFGVNLNSPQMSGYLPVAKELFSKLLTEALGRWEEKSGFDVDHYFGLGDRRPADIMHGIPGSLFNQQLADGRPFKDLGAGPAHGEYSHRIQWYIIGNGLPLRNAGDVYRDVKRWISVGGLLNHAAQENLEQTTTSVFSDLGTGAYRRYLWEYLFDRDGDPPNATTIAFKAEKKDFRAPSNLNAHLRDLNCNDYPLLSWCVIDRYKKRTDPARIAVEDYFLKKVPDNSDFLNLKNGDATTQVAAGKGLFIRRKTFGVSVDWQNLPKK